MAGEAPQGSTEVAYYCCTTWYAAIFSTSKHYLISMLHLLVQYCLPHKSNYVQQI